MSNKVAIVWFRQDLRLKDNPALLHAAKESYDILPVFIHDPEGEEKWPYGGASNIWLHHSLKSLEDSLQKREGKLFTFAGDSQDILETLIKETKAEAVFWNRRYEPAIIKRDSKIKETLSQKITVQSFNGSLLLEPWKLQNKQGKPFQVFTPFWKTLSASLDPFKLPSLPKPMSFYSDKITKLRSIDSLELLPKIPWDKTMMEYWEISEDAALKRLKQFTDEKVQDYKKERDFPSVQGTSQLSPYLHFGLISPQKCWNHLIDKKKTEPFMRQLGWREFAYHLLYHFPQTPLEALKSKFDKFPWKKSKKDLESWQKGETGYPIVDAGMRELWKTGYMHNRVRMIVGSFLVKDLMIPWQEGAKWFWDTLVDADLANNTLGWQWVAGCGADAAPYFRIFNPILQSKKFDAKGEYIKKWVPELGSLPPKFLHEPWIMTKEEQEEALFFLGKSYPNPIVDHAEARKEALMHYSNLKD